CNSHNAHFIGGATADAALHVMPFVKKSWETPAGRIATVAIGGVGLELADYVQCRQAHSCGREDAGFGFVDLGYDVAGAVATELLIAGLKHVPGLRHVASLAHDEREPDEQVTVGWLAAARRDRGRPYGRAGLARGASGRGARGGARDGDRARDRRRRLLAGERRAMERGARCAGVSTGGDRV